MKFDEEIETDRAIKILEEAGYRGEVIDRIDLEPERWYDADDVDELSQEEARVLAERWIAQAMEAGLLNSEQARSAREPLANEVLSAITESFRTGELGRLGLEALTEALAAGVDPNTRDRIRDWLGKKLP